MPMRDPPDHDTRSGASAHSLSLTSAYGELLAREEVPAAEFAAALRRFHDRAVERASAVIVLDGITHTRHSFLEFVRHFQECGARAARLQAR